MVMLYQVLHRGRTATIASWSKSWGIFIPTSGGKHVIYQSIPHEHSVMMDTLDSVGLCKFNTIIVDKLLAEVSIKKQSKCYSLYHTKSSSRRNNLESEQQSLLIWSQTQVYVESSNLQYRWTLCEPASSTEFCLALCTVVTLYASYSRQKYPCWTLLDHSSML